MNSEIRSGDITLGILLGKSRFGDVFVGSHHRSSRFAVKRLFQYASSHFMDALRSEMNSIRNLSSEFVVAVHAMNDHHASPDQPVLLIMERLHESLFSAYRAMPAPSLRQRIEWLVQAGNAISVFHSLSPPVLHCNIKPSSMLISSPATGRRLKMVDFRVRKVLRDLAASERFEGGFSTAAFVGNPRYMAPELISCKPNYTTHSDVYSFGVVVWEVCCMRLPFADCDDMQILKTDIKNGMREDFPFDFPIQLKEMISNTWITAPTQRPSIHECVKCLQNFLTTLNKATLAPPADLSNITWPIKKEASAREFDQIEAISAIFLLEDDHILKELKSRFETAAHHALYFTASFCRRTDFVPVFFQHFHFSPDVIAERDIHGRNWLHYAALHSRSVDVLKMMILKCAGHANLQLHVKDISGQYPLHIAVCNKQSYDIFRVLLDDFLRTAPSAVPEYAADVLHYAANYCEDVAIVHELIKANPGSLAVPSVKYPQYPLSYVWERTMQTSSSSSSKVDDVFLEILEESVDYAADQKNEVFERKLWSLFNSWNTRNWNKDRGRGSRSDEVCVAFVAAHPDAANADALMILLRFDFHKIMSCIFRLSCHPIHTCLLISRKLQTLSTPDMESAHLAVNVSSSLETLACCMVACRGRSFECDKNDLDRCLRFALYNKRSKFVSQPICNQRIDYLWKGSKVAPVDMPYVVFRSVASVFVDSEKHKPSACTRFFWNRLLYAIFLICCNVFIRPQKMCGEIVSYAEQQIFLLFWFCTILLDEAIECITCVQQSMWRRYMTDGWNLLDIAAFIVGITASILRVTVYNEAQSCDVDVSNQVMAWAILLLWARFVNVMLVFPFVGPLIITVLRMIFHDMSKFILLVVTIELPFVISLCYLNSDREEFSSVLSSASSFFKTLFGQGPSFNDYDESSWFLLSFASIMLVVMLINLLIAMFSKTFEDVRENSSIEYQMQLLDLAFLWSQKTMLQPPLNIFSYLSHLIACCLQIPAARHPPISQSLRQDFEQIVPQHTRATWKKAVLDDFYDKVPAKHSQTNLGLHQGKSAAQS